MMQWSHKTKAVDCGPYFIETEVYRTGGIPKIVIIGGGECALPNGFISRMFRSRRPIEERFDWLFELSSNFKDEIEVEDLQVAFEKIDELVQSKNYVEVDEAIEVLAKHDFSHELQSNLMRYTFGIRDKLPSWNETMEVLIGDLRSHEIDAEGLLLGVA